MTGPAFILGNGPTLPVADLPALAGCFTVGVNRILRSGFVPTVIMLVDGDVWRQESAAIEASGALCVVDRSIAERQGQIALPFVPGDGAWQSGRPDRYDRIYCAGNTGVAAARWALALGCRPVYLLGMAAAGPGDFWGDNPRHNADAMANMRGELTRLKAAHGADVEAIADGAGLRAASAAAPVIDQPAARAELRRLLAGYGVG